MNVAIESIKNKCVSVMKLISTIESYQDIQDKLKADSVEFAIRFGDNRYSLESVLDSDTYADVKDKCVEVIEDHAKKAYEQLEQMIGTNDTAEPEEAVTPSPQPMKPIEHSADWKVNKSDYIKCATCNKDIDFGIYDKGMYAYKLKIKNRISYYCCYSCMRNAEAKSERQRVMH